jgi:putative CocE/NonD family hydrolase
MPEAEGRFPAVIECLPYRKDDLGLSSLAAHRYFAARGYVSVRIDSRGTGNSPGHSLDEYTEQEQHDAYDACEWLAVQDWCSGTVGAFGTSYGGYTACQLAANRPPHLKAIAPMHGFDDRYTDDCHYAGGQLQTYDVGRYGTRMLATNALPPLPEPAGSAWLEMWTERLEKSESWLLKWLGHQADGPYWRVGSIRDRVGEIDCAVLCWGGWQDGYVNPILRMFPLLRGPKRAIIGPWMHARPDTGPPGPLVDWLAETTRWWDQWLKGEDTGVTQLAPVVFYVQGFDKPSTDRTLSSGYWREETSLPPTTAGELTLHLHESQRLRSSRGAVMGKDRLDYRFMGGMASGEFSAGGLPNFGLPLDQRLDAPTSLGYVGPVLSAPLEILGRPVAVLHVESSARILMYCVRLCDVAPDGSAALVSKGNLNATRRSSLTAPEPLEPGRTYRLEIALNATAWRFEPGHRIQLQIGNAEFPRLWPTPELAVGYVHRGGDRSSSVTLPTIATGYPRSPSVEFEAPSSSSPAPTDETIRDAYQDVIYHVLDDAVEARSGFTRSARLPDGSEFDDSRKLSTWASNADPSHARARGETEIELRRGEWSVVASARSEVVSNEGSFSVTQRLSVRLNGSIHHEREWSESVPRNLL